MSICQKSYLLIFSFIVCLCISAGARASADALTIPPAAVSSDAILTSDADYYASHPEEDPLFLYPDAQAQAVGASAGDNLSLASADYSYVRILLSTADAASRGVTLSGNYSLINSAGNVCALPSYGSVYDFSASGSTVTVSCGGAVLASGARFTLQEHIPIGGTDGNAFSLYNNSYSCACSYRGSLIVYAENGKLRFVNRVYIEEYLCGVVGNEIGDGTSIEALKAQAVAARSYAVRNIAPAAAYDMLDTSTSQVYKGICAADVRSAQAVAATAKQVIINGSSIVLGLYSSSNGGEKDTSRNRWGGNPAWPGEAVKTDLYDLAYSISYAKQKSNSYYEEAVIPANGIKTAATNALITHSLLPLLVQNGYCAQGTTVASVTLASVYMEYVPMQQTDAVTYLSDLRVRYMGNVSGVSFDIMDSIPYTRFYVSQGWGLFANGNLNQYWITLDGNGNYVLRHARRGHGIGLSQIGARQMALDGAGYGDILRFYYDGASPAASALIGDKTLTVRGFALPKGDADTNGRIDVTDVVYVCRAIAGALSLNATQRSNADVNLDGSVSLADAILICRYIAGIL